MPKDKPQFGLTCIKSDYPVHLIPGVKYKVNPWKTNVDIVTGKKEVSVYWANPLSAESIEWFFIGYFPIDNFNIFPLQEWIRKKKGLPAVEPKTVRSRPVVTRSRPVIQRQRARG